MRNSRCSRWVRGVWLAWFLAGVLVAVEGAETAARHLAGEVKEAMRAVRRGDGDEARTGVLDLALLAGEVLEEESFRGSVRGLVGLLADDRGGITVARRSFESLMVREDLPLWASEVLEDILREAVDDRDLGLRTEAVRLLLMRDGEDIGAQEALLDLMDHSRAGVRMGALSVLLDLSRVRGYEASGAVKGRLRQRLEGEDTAWGFDAGMALWVIAQVAEDSSGLVEAEAGMARGLEGARGEELGILLRRMEIVLEDRPILAPGGLLEEVLRRVVEERSPEFGVLAAVDLALLAPVGGEVEFSGALERVLPAYMGHPSLDIRMAAFGALGRYGAVRLLGMGAAAEFPSAVREVLPKVFDLPVSEVQVRAVGAMMGDAAFVDEYSEEMVRVVAVALASADRLVMRAAFMPELAGLYVRPEAEKLRGWLVQDLEGLGEDGVAFCLGPGVGAFGRELMLGRLEVLLSSEVAGVRRVAGAALLEIFRKRGDEMGAWLGWFGRLAADEHPSVAWYGVGGLALGGSWDVEGYRRRLGGLLEAADPGVRLRLLGLLGGSEVPAWGGRVLKLEEGEWLRGLRVRMMRESDEVMREVLGRER